VAKKGKAKGRSKPPPKSDAKPPPKSKGGRPSEYDPKYCKMLIEHMTEDGLSFESFAGVVGKSVQTLYNWEKANPEFLDAKKKGEAGSRLFWEKMGMTGMTGRLPRFNVVAWIFSMKNRHGWRNDPLDDRPPDRNAVVEDAIQALEREDAGKPPAPAHDVGLGGAIAGPGGAQVPPASPPTPPRESPTKGTKP
jgi:hypothetical protein